MEIRDIRDKIRSGDYKFSDHAVKRMIKREISRQEIETVICNGKIIEEYPDDKYSPSCLIFGRTEEGRKLHIQMCLPPKVVIITAYDPAPEEWIEFETRR